jgi:hypothetical protein
VHERGPAPRAVCTRYGTRQKIAAAQQRRQKLDTALAKDTPYIKLVPSGVATVAALQGKGFAYLKVG